jgi:acetyltransferase-like isoleucine patch superfamily enzyme
MILRDEAKTALQTRLTAQGKGALRKYTDLVVGRPGLGALMRYELLTCLAGPMPGAAGYALRGLLWPRLLAEAGRGVVFGRNVTIRHPHKIRIGAGTIVDENCVLDAKGEANHGISIGAGVILARNTVLSCKDGDISIGDTSNLSMNCLIHSERSVVLGSGVLIAAYCYLVGGGSHDFERADVPVIQQESLPSRGIVLENGVWLAARVTVLDGVRIGRGAIVGAGAVVRDDVPAGAVAVGTPARVVRMRAQS